jgi:ferredoxin-2, mitochondrial
LPATPYHTHDVHLLDYHNQSTFLKEREFIPIEFSKFEKFQNVKITFDDVIFPLFVHAVSDLDLVRHPSSYHQPPSMINTMMTITTTNMRLLLRIHRNAIQCGRPRIPAAGVARWHSAGPKIASDAPTVNITFTLPDGTTKRTVQARIGESLLQTAHRNDIDLEGACEGVCACSTCHLIFPPEDEEDMLDMAFGLTETSRLGCQINVTNEMNGLELQMPAATRNFYVDGHVPKPH